MDIGASRRVFRETCGIDQKLKEKNPSKVKTATGEVANASGDLKLDAWDEKGATTSCSGSLSLVRELLIVTGEVSDKDSGIWRSGDNAYIMGEELQDTTRRAEHVRSNHAKAQRYRHCPSLQGVSEVYSVNVSVQHGASTSESRIDFCANDGPSDPRCVKFPLLSLEDAKPEFD